MVVSSGIDGGGVEALTYRELPIRTLELPIWVSVVLLSMHNSDTTSHPHNETYSRLVNRLEQTPDCIRTAFRLLRIDQASVRWQ